MQKRVTLVDIARATGYSVNSVSRALMDASDISEKTKKIIRETADELGYVPNIAAASLKNGNSKIIGILYDDILNPYYNTVIYYLERILSEKNYSIINYRSQEFDSGLYNDIVSRNLEGVISFLTPTEIVSKKSNAQKFPTVVIGRKAENVSSVYADNIKIGQLAAKAILKRNCKKPIYVGENIDVTISRERQKGFSDEVKLHNLKDEYYFGATPENISSVVSKIIKKEVDSIFCFSDFIAFRVVKELYKQNLMDVVVVGVDNIQAEIPFPVDIISIGQSKEKIAKDAIELLFKQIQGLSNSTQFIEEEIYLVEEF